jgi:hypothetical protein
LKYYIPDQFISRDFFAHPKGSNFEQHNNEETDYLLAGVLLRNHGIGAKWQLFPHTSFSHKGKFRQRMF